MLLPETFLIASIKRFDDDNDDVAIHQDENQFW